MRRYEYPKISSQTAPAVQLEEIKLYLHKLVDMLNLNQEGSSSLNLFSEAFYSLKEAEMPDDSQSSPAGKQLGAVAVALVAAVLTSKKSYFLEENGELKQTGFLNAEGSVFRVGELAAKVQRLENEIKKLKGE